MLAPFNLHAIKGEWTAGLLSNDLSRIVDVRCPPTTPRPVFSVRKTVQTTTQRLLRLLSFPDFSPRRSPGSDHFTDVVVQSLRCRLSLPPRVSTDVTQRRRDDNLQVIWRASQRVLCSKLYYLRLCWPKMTSIYRSVQRFTKCQMTSKSISTSTFFKTIILRPHSAFKLPVNRYALSGNK